MQIAVSLVSIQSNLNLTTIQFDTKGTHAESPLSQFYRDMHGYIVMCDVMNMQSMRDIPR